MIRFAAKVAGEKVLSLPLVKNFYFPVQKWVARSINVTAESVRVKLDIGRMYIQRTQDAGLGTLLDRCPILDLGAGWHLTIPLLYARLGASAQILTDVRRLARREIVSAVSREVNREDLGVASTRFLPDWKNQSLDEYLLDLGIEYKAPVRSPLPLSANSIDAVLCTQVLIYPRRNVVRAILEDVARIMRPGGVFIATTHLYDLYSNYDPSLSRFNFLRYSRKTWETWIESRLITYNRLRASDYRALLQDLPFEPIIWEVTPPSDEDLKHLARIRIHREFKPYEQNDLASPHLFFMLRRK